MKTTRPKDSSILRRLGLLLALPVTLSATAPAEADLSEPARFWISRSASQPLAGLNANGVLPVTLLPASEWMGLGEEAALHIWAQPAKDSAGNFKKLQNITLNLVTTQGRVDLQDNISIVNPARFISIRDSYYPDDPLNPNLNLETFWTEDVYFGFPDQALGIQAANPPSLEITPGTGLGPEPDVETVSTPFGAAWRLASFSVRSLSLLGEESLYLQIGSGGMNHEVDGLLEFSADTSVIFAPPGHNSPVYNAGPSGHRNFTWVGDLPEVVFQITESTGLPGDFNGDGTVDGADFLAWQRNPSLGNLSDWENQFGQSSLAASAFPVPEPVSWVLFGWLVLTLFGLRHRHSLRKLNAVPALALLSMALSLDAVRADTVITVNQTQNGGTLAVTPPTLVISHGSNDPLLTLTGGADTSGAQTTIVGSLNGESGNLLIEAGSTMVNGGNSTLIGPYGSIDVFRGWGYLGLNTGSQGAATVTGEDSLWALSLNFFVGHSGAGILNIVDGGRVTNPIGHLGFEATGHGTATVSGVHASGSRSTWTSSTELRVGYSGTGILNIEAGGLVTNANALVGRFEDSHGTAKVTGVHASGARSTWQTSGGHFVGTSGTGILSIEDGGWVTSNQGLIGNNDTGHGTATVTGVNTSGDRSTWQNANVFRVGNFGTGILNIEDGGWVTNTQGYIGGQEGSHGTATVKGVHASGIRSSWENSDLLRVGSIGTGILNIEDGGWVTNTTGFVGTFADGTATVVGVHALGHRSTWENTDSLTVGYSSTGILNVEEGGWVTSNAGSWIGRFEDGHGIATVAGVHTSGDRSTWETSGFLVVGNSGTGILNVEQGGRVLSASGYVGIHNNSHGTVTVTGAGSQWTNNGDLILGGTTLTNATTAMGILTVENGGLVTVGGTLKLHPGGTLQGHGGTVAGNLSNSGRVAPGNSPGIITIDGDFTQTSTGTLEIEVGGLTPGTQHDQLQVSGTASLAGRLEVPIIDGFVPSSGQEILFLTTGLGTTGAFDSIVSPNLATVAPNVALRVVPVGTGRKIEFVTASTAIEFIDTDPASLWSNPSSWLSNTVPTSTDIIDLENQAGVAQQINVQTENAFVHQLSVTGGANPLTVAVHNSRTLSSTTSVTIGNNGAVTLQGGTLSSATIEVLAGGQLTGNGTVITNTLTVSGGTLSPGFSVGHLDIQGNYQQGAGGTLLMDLEGTGSGQFDTVAVSGSVELGGSLQIDVSELASVMEGDTYTLITAAQGSGMFDRVEVIDPHGVADGYYFSPFYGSPAGEGLAAMVDGYLSGGRWLTMGDANGDGIVDEIDARVFAAVLIDNTLQGFHITPTTAAANNFVSAFDFYTEGAPPGQTIIDFDDIPGFLDKLATSQQVSVSTAYQVFSTAYQEVLSEATRTQVPEPSTAILLGLGAGAMLGRRRRVESANGRNSSQKHLRLQGIPK